MQSFASPMKAWLAALAAALAASALVPSTGGGQGLSTAAVPARVGCTRAQTTTLVNRFVTAFNAGERATLNNSIWGGKLYFNWYAVTAEPGRRISPDAGRRNTLMDYFAARHDHGERLTLTSFTVNGAKNGVQNFVFRLVRSADDQPGFGLLPRQRRIELLDRTPHHVDDGG